MSTGCLAIRHTVAQVPPSKRLPAWDGVNSSHVKGQPTFAATSDSTGPFFENDLGIAPTTAPYNILLNALE